MIHTLLSALRHWRRTVIHTNRWTILKSIKYTLAIIIGANSCTFIIGKALALLYTRAVFNEELWIAARYNTLINLHYISWRTCVQALFIHWNTAWRNTLYLIILIQLVKWTGWYILETCVLMGFILKNIWRALRYTLLSTNF